MKTLRKYVIGETLIGISSTLGLFVVLFFLFDLVHVLSDGGQLATGLGLVVLRSALEIPSWIYELVPLSALTGSLIVLARFSSNSEYVVMRSSGMSLKNLALILSIVALIASSITLIVGELVIPKTQKMLQTIDVKTGSDQHVVAQTFRSGHWIKDRDRIINITRLTKDFQLSGILIFELNAADRAVTRIIKASSGSIKDENWDLRDVRMTDIFSDRLVRSKHSTMNLNTNINPQIINSLLAGESNLTYLELAHYIEHLENNGEDVYRYKSVQWAKIGHLVTVFLLILIAPTFVGFESRGRHAGFWIFIGSLSGVGLYFMNQLLKSIGTIARWHPAAYTFIPIVVILMMAYWFVANREKR